MTTNDLDPHAATDKNFTKLEANIAKIETLTQRLLKAMGHGRAVPPSLQGPSQELYTKAATGYFTEMMQNPAKLVEHQVEFWGKSVKHFVEAQHLLAQGKLEPATDETPKDRRFANEMWDTNPYFNFIKQQYMMNAAAVQQAVEDIDALDPDEKNRLRYFSQQIVDMACPTNFLATNPEALALAAETEGESLIAGLENMISDLEANNGDLVVTLADKSAFKLGENLATTPGSVVFRNRLFELIQYAPTTEKVHTTPLIIFPPWINKFYILDLKPQNSLIKWAVDQGHTVFVVSWVNPDASFSGTTMTDYIEEGYLAAIGAVKDICGVKKVNAVGYCIAGTTLSLALGVMKKRKDTSVNCATFFTTLTDFSDRGEVGVFLNDDFVDGIEAEAMESGILDSFYMSRTFSYLRANDLIYGPAIKSYMMGKAPPAFDLLYWNGDGTNLPASMAVDYLRGLCQGDRLANEGFEVCGETIQLKDVTVPLCAVACETDHIAAWKSSYTGVQKMGSKDKTFILSESGHVAGIINPPSKKKYGHYTNPEQGLTADDWYDAADKHDGSWWPRWESWLAEKSCKKVDARQPGGECYPVLAAAPGTYVLAK
ncbi:class I poly(R)-hydroxyalkanoic acid synthase [Loktanella sp. D2R18]|uniref:class I poly(R)-hydroxyalkanoic acid synthase n=1 Tax=Rhodobacterales TaxID=204455 RepID=UPI000DEB8BDF|nr:MULTISPECIES: class I poly(R)-hydroxyalkanoic acid synthase [Rhodobacterales]MDO6591682.1 class I poly(R)-hydroxyalkanoic acid synthase [Yoonia sp. 1_MG-2023]RBW42513.1 class I poly(R)-hydroxyalkanoic acid synthase [Loktanella sp. D2R18]